MEDANSLMKKIFIFTEKGTLTNQLINSEAVGVFIDAITNEQLSAGVKVDFIGKLREMLREYRMLTEYFSKINSKSIYIYLIDLYLQEKNNSSLQKAILDLSNETGVASEDIANNVYDAISAGQKTGDAVNFVSNATKLAKAGFTDTASSNISASSVSTVIKKSSISVLSYIFPFLSLLYVGSILFKYSENSSFIPYFIFIFDKSSLFDILFFNEFIQNEVSLFLFLLSFNIVSIWCAHSFFSLSVILNFLEFIINFNASS